MTLDYNYRRSLKVTPVTEKLKRLGKRDACHVTRRVLGMKVSGYIYGSRRRPKKSECGDD